MSSCVRGCASVLVYGSVCRGANVREPVPLYGARPPGLCTMCFCAHAGACVDELMCETLYICTVRAHKSFVLLCSRAGRCTNELRCESSYVCTVRAHIGFVRCEPTRILYNVLVLAHQGFVQCTSVLVRKRVQMSSRTRACTSVRCEPTRALYNVILSSCTSACAHEGFVRCACAHELMCESMCRLCGASPQRPCVVCSCK